jgi:hypothetical protein
MNEPTFLSQPSITVRRIKVLSFSMDEINIAEDALFKVDFNQQFSFNLEDNLAFTVLKVWYSVPMTENDPRIVLECQTQNIFQVPNMKDFVKPDGTVLFPNDVLINITSMSITHSRAAIALQTAGSVFGDTLIPVVNPVEATMAFFKSPHQPLLTEEKKNTKEIALAPAKDTPTIEDQLRESRERITRLKKQSDELRPENSKK